MLTYTLKVEKLQKETEDTVTIFFKQPALKKIKYLAGQYLTLIFRINGRRYIRPYSFSSAPGFENTLNVTVKRVVGGVVSNHILDKVKVGDVIEVMQPMGDFTLDKIPVEVENKHVVFWGSGSGITPLISLAKYALGTSYSKNITLVYGNRNFETTIFSQEIEELENKYAGTFSVWHFHSRAAINKSNPNVVEGRIDPKKVLSIMSKEHEMKNTFHFICGPVGLKDSVKSVLADLGVSDDHIFSEDFDVTRDPKEFENVVTRNVSLLIGNQKVTFEVTKGKTILESGLDAMVELSYSCQTGSCMLCKAKLVNGKVKTIGIAKLPDDVKADECLLCCAFPLTGNVELLIKN